MFIYLLVIVASSMSLTDRTEKVRSGDLIVDVINIKTAKGELVACLSNESDSFLTDCYLSEFVAQFENGTSRLVFRDLPMGQYALSLFQDLNKNRLLDKNALHLPTEPFGFSNNPNIIFGPPTFRKCKFSTSESQTYLTIKLKKF